jgi:hypothetical protein
MTGFKTSDRGVNRAIRSWLHEDRHEDASRLAGAVLDQMDTIPQRRATWWPARRTPTTNKIFGFGLAAAAVVVVLIVGAQFAGSRGNGGLGAGSTAPSAPASLAMPSASAEASEAAEPTVSQQARTLTFDIEPMATGGEARGTVVVDIAGGGYTMTITVEDLDPNGQYPINMFAGQCPNPELPSPDNPGVHVPIVSQTPADESGTLTYEKEFEGLWEIPEAGRTLTIGGRAPAEANTNIACADLTE